MKAAEMTARHICKMHGIDVSSNFTNILEWGLPSDTQMNMEGHAKKRGPPNTYGYKKGLIESVGIFSFF